MSRPRGIDELLARDLSGELKDDEAKALSEKALEDQETFDALWENEEMRATAASPEAWPEEVLADLEGGLAHARKKAQPATAVPATPRTVWLRRVGLAAAAVLVAGFVAWNRRVFEPGPSTFSLSPAAPTPKSEPATARQNEGADRLPASVDESQAPKGPRVRETKPPPRVAIPPAPTLDYGSASIAAPTPAPAWVPAPADEPVPAPAPVAEPYLEDIFFAPGRVDLPQDQYDGLDRSAELLVGNRDWAVVIEAHGDGLKSAVAPPPWQRRASAVRDALLARGVKPEQVEVEKISGGPCPENDSACRSMSDRVHLKPYRLK